MTNQDLSESFVALPDLVYKDMQITAVYASAILNASAIIENIGWASVTGPFAIDVQVSINNRTEISQRFEVPASVRLGSLPVLHQFLARRVAITNPWQTQYMTPPLVAPLIFIDEHHDALYTASFIIDPLGQVTEMNESNNMFAYNSGRPFWFLSPAASKRKQPFVIDRTKSANQGATARITQPASG